MAEGSLQQRDKTDVDAVVEHLRLARRWGWEVFDHRASGPSRDLAWALIGLARDHDPDTYSPWLKASALELETQLQALDLAYDIARLIRKADALQPQLVMTKEVRS